MFMEETSDNDVPHVMLPTYLVDRYYCDHGE